MARVVLVLLVWLAPGFAARGQPPLFDPGANFYKARGAGVKVEFAVEPGEIPAGGECTLTLTVRNAFNPRQVVRPDLRKRPEFETLFQIRDLPRDPPKADAREVKFAYVLRPRTDGTIELPRLPFVYLSQADKPNTTYTQKGLLLTVTPAVVASPSVRPVEGPESLFRFASGPETNRPAPRPPHWIAAVFLTLLGPLLGLTWFTLWRRLCPDAALLAKLRRGRAARVAMRTLAKADRAADPPAAVADALRGYLRDRFGLSPHATTPGEVRDALPASPLLEDALGLLERCDAARFSPAGDGSLSAEARDRIAAWEAA